MSPMGSDFKSLLFPHPTATAPLAPDNSAAERTALLPLYHAAGPTDVRAVPETCPVRPNTDLGTTNSPVGVSTPRPCPRSPEDSIYESMCAEFGLGASTPRRDQPPAGRHSRDGGGIPVERLLGRPVEPRNRPGCAVGRHALPAQEYFGSADGAA